MRIGVRVGAVVLPLVLSLSAMGPADAAELRQAALPVAVGGPVQSLAIGREGLFVGGNFASIGPFTGPGAQLDASSGTPGGVGQRFDDVVDVVIADGAGGWYVGGRFRQADGQPEVALVHLVAGGSLDPSFHARVLGSESSAARVHGLALVGSRLYVAGSFSSIGGGSQPMLAAVDAGTGSLVSSFRPTFAGDPPTVAAVAATSDRVYAGGTFTTQDGTRKNLAAFDPATGAVVPTFNPSGNATPRPDDVAASVFALALAGPRLIVGGRFNAVGGRPRNHVAALDAASGAVDPAFDPNADAEVDALLVDGSRLFVGGGFDFVNGRPRRRLAAVDLATGAIDPAFTAEADRQVLALALADNRLIVGGRFRSLAGASRASLGAVDATTGQLDTGFDPEPGRVVDALAAAGGQVYAGGDFLSARAAPRAGLALLDPATGRLRDFRPGIPVRAKFALAGGRLIVADGRPEATDVLRLRALDRGTGRLLTAFRPPDLPRYTYWVPAGAGFCATLGSTVHCYDARGRSGLVARTAGGEGGVAPLVHGSTLYLSGSFARVDGLSRRSLAAIDMRSGRVLRAFRPTLRSVWITALAAGGGRLYVGANGRLVALDARSGRVVRRYPRAGATCGWAACDALIVGRRYWAHEGARVRALDLPSGTLLARVDFSRGVDDIAVAGRRVYVGSGIESWIDPLGAPDASQPFLTALDLRG